MATATGTTPASTDVLRRQLGVGSAAAIVAGEAIAVGIFLTPAGMAKSLASPFWLLIVWLAVGAMTLSGALCYGELAGRFPSAGGAYVYLRECFGPRTAFLYGWMCLLVLDPGLTAAFATGFAAYAAYIFHWPPLIIKVAAVAAIWAICVLNIFSTRISASFLRWITWLKFAVLRSEEHTSELQSQFHLVCRLLLEKKKKKQKNCNQLQQKKKQKIKQKKKKTH